MFWLSIIFISHGIEPGMGGTWGPDMLGCCDTLEHSIGLIESVMGLWFDTGLERFIPRCPWPCLSNYILVQLMSRALPLLLRCLDILASHVRCSRIKTMLVPVYILQANHPKTWIQNSSSGSFRIQTMFASKWILIICPVNIAVCIFSVHYSTPRACSRKDYTLSECSVLSHVRALLSFQICFHQLLSGPAQNLSPAVPRFKFWHLPSGNST